jgi:uncharacterized repeat protein (TIGR03803 family)
MRVISSIEENGIDGFAKGIVMQCRSLLWRGERLWVPALMLLAYTFAAHGEDTFDGSQLKIPSLVIGSATYTNVVVTPASIVSEQMGTAVGTQDSYNPANKQLTIPIVFYAGTTYTNVVITVRNLVSVGGVTGVMDFVNGPELNIPLVQVLGGALYHDVLITIGGIVSQGGGMPASLGDVYNPATKELTIAVIQYGNQIYTNAVITVGTILSVGPTSVPDSVLYSFTGSIGQPGVNGVNPSAGLILGSDGYLYGTTGVINSPGENGGGAYQRGTIFRLRPAGGVESVLYSFGAGGDSDGTGPTSRLIQDSEGNFYGTTVSGGAYNQGTVFKISPVGVETWLYSFSGDGPGPGEPGEDGSTPYAGLIVGNDSNFYGTTTVGGAYGYGTVFRITPEGVETVLYSFTEGNVCVNYVCHFDGGQPWAPLILGHDGNFYGTTSSGGANDGAGTVFRITPDGTETLLYSFGGSPLAASADGRAPEAGLTLGSDGNYYGTTSFGGEYNSGIVFRVTPSGVETVLHSFSGGYITAGLGVHITDGGGVPGSWDGATPSYGSLVQGSTGNFYGTTTLGGAYNSGSVFEIGPTGLELVLLSFSGAGGIAGSTDAANPYGGLLPVGASKFYGTTDAGGADNEGTVFSFTLPAPAP